MAKQQTTEQGASTTEHTESKLAKILRERNLSQADFIKLIEKKTKCVYQKANVSRIVNKKVSFMSTETAKIMAKALDVTIDDIVD